MDYKIDQLTYNNNTYKFIDNTTTIGTGLSKSVNNAGPVLNHSNSVTAKTTQALYPITFDTQGHITGAGSAQTIPDVSNKIDTAGSGLSKSGTTLNHSNSITAQTTRALYPIKIDAQGHISEYGSAVTIPTVPSSGSSATNIGATSSGGSATTWSKSDHVHKLNITLNNQNYTPDSNGVINLGNISEGGGGTVTGIKMNGSDYTPNSSGIINLNNVVTSVTKAMVDSAIQTTSSTTKFYREDGTWAVPAGGSGSVIPSVIIERW